MKKLLPIGALGLAGLVGVGLMSFPTTTVAANTGDDDAFVKREEHVSELALVADDDDDDTNDDSDTNTNTGNSRATNDNTRSNVTAMSRDRDHSRSDKTKDFTRDGGDGTRDITPNLTNDRSRNDTRGRR